MKNTITELKNLIEGFNIRPDSVPESISELKDRVVESIQSKGRKGKRMKKSEDSLKDLWDNIRQTNMYATGAPEREEWENEAENITNEITAENFCNLGK